MKMSIRMGGGGQSVGSSMRTDKINISFASVRPLFGPSASFVSFSAVLHKYKSFLTPISTTVNGVVLLRAFSQ